MSWIKDKCLVMDIHMVVNWQFYDNSKSSRALISFWYHHEFRHDIVMQSSCGSTRPYPSESADYFGNIMTKFMINKRTDALKPDVNLLTVNTTWNLLTSITWPYRWLNSRNQNYCWLSSVQNMLDNINWSLNAELNNSNQICLLSRASLMEL